MSSPPPKPTKPETFVGTKVDQDEKSDIKNKRMSTKVSDILALDIEDESLRKYKETLLGSAAHGDLGNINDPRKLIIEEFRVLFAPEENLPDLIFNLNSSEGLELLKNQGMTLREGVKFKFRITFRVQHEILCGIKFVNTMNRMLISETEELVLGSYPPSSTPHIFEFPKWDYNEAPKGMLFRGKYQVVNSFVDSDKNTHLKFEYECSFVKA